MLRVLSISRSTVVLSVLAAAGCSQADDTSSNPGEDAGLGSGSGGTVGGEGGGGASLATGGTKASGTGGSSGNAGATASGGALTGTGTGGSANGAGGSANSGGASQAGAGGAPSNGGAPGTGGVPSTGGTTATGGTSGTGGTMGTGGTTATGGTLGTGGDSCTCTGGVPATGGKTGTGGVTGTGGKTGTGGITGTGGKTGTGGTTGSGGVTGSGGTPATGGATGTGGAGGACVTGSGPLPTIGGCTVFKADSPWNTQINCAPLHSRNTQFMAAFDIDAAHRAVHLDLGSTETQYGIPSTVVPASQATVPITYGVGGENYSPESDQGPFPLPLNAPIEGQNGATDPTNGDRHVLVVQQGTCTLFELYKTVRVTASPAGFKCASSAKWDLTTNSTRPAGWTSADAAGLPIFPGLIRYAEIQAGAINHALRVTAPNAQNSYIPPAGHNGPDTNTDPTLPPYGLRIRMKSSYSEAGYSTEARVLLTALKNYGLIYADQGTGWYISGSSDPGLENLIDEIHSTRPIPSSAFEAVYTGDTVCGWGAPAVCK